MVTRQRIMNILRKIVISIIAVLIVCSFIRGICLECGYCSHWFKWEKYFVQWLCEKERFGSVWNAFVALWVGALSVFTFVIAKTTEIYYGIHLGNILLWKFGLVAVVAAIIIYFSFFPMAVICYMKTWAVVFLYILIWGYIYLISMLVFVCQNMRKTSFRKAIKEQTIKKLKKVFNTSIENKAEEVNLLAAMNVIRNVDYANSEETKNLTKLIKQVIKSLLRQSPNEYYSILNPFVTAIIETSGVDKRYESDRTIEFLVQLWKQTVKLANTNRVKNSNEKKTLLAFGILAPLIEHTPDNLEGKDFSSLLRHLEYAIRTKVLLLSLLYIEYLYVCDNYVWQSIEVLKKFHISDFLDELGKQDYSVWLWENWCSWNVANEQSLAGRPVVEQFVTDLEHWNDKGYIGKTYILIEIKRG